MKVFLPGPLLLTHPHVLGSNNHSVWSAPSQTSPAHTQGPCGSLCPPRTDARSTLHGAHATET